MPVMATIEVRLADGPLFTRLAALATEVVEHADKHGDRELRALVERCHEEMQSLDVGLTTSHLDTPAASSTQDQ